MHKHSFVATVRVGSKDLRERGRDVFLPFGTDYHLHLHNKADKPMLAFVRVDGRLIDNGRARRIGPGERCEIAGFAQDDGQIAEFRFTERTGAVERHRGKRRKDGLVEVAFAIDDRPGLIEELERVAREIKDEWERRGPPLRPIWRDYPPLRPIWRDYPPASPWDPFPGRLYPVMPLTYAQGGRAGSPIFSDSTVANAESVATRAAKGLTVPGQFVNDECEAPHEAESSWEKVRDKVSVMRLRLNGAWPDGSAVEVPLFARERVQCTTCGGRHKSSVRFCGHCGTNLRASI